jgi:hypothetical protein
MAVLTLGVIMGAVSPVAAQAATPGDGSAIKAPAHHLPRRHDARSLDKRVTMLSKALGLDAKQQSELRRVLEDQREQVNKIWNDTSVPAAQRVSATQAITDKTADQIRALLSEEQKKLYSPPKPPREAAAGSPRPSVETWMSPARAR